MTVVLMDFRTPMRQLPGIQDDYNRKGLVSDKGEKKKAFFTLPGLLAQNAAVTGCGHSVDNARKCSGLEEHLCLLAIARACFYAPM